MTSDEKPLRVLYSFPHKLGAARICTTAWHQVAGLAEAGAQVTVLTNSICRPLPSNIRVHTTLAVGRLRLPERILGSRRTSILHDWLVARRLPSYANQIDAVHVWPLGALHTIRAARKLGLKTYLERPNAHTAFAYEIVQQECRKLGLTMPPGHEHDSNPTILAYEESEYAETDYLLCPSDFVAKTFSDRGFPKEKLLRNQYGFDDTLFFPGPTPQTQIDPFTLLFVGGCAPRKGVHYALEAWSRLPVGHNARFLIAGEFIPGYAERLGSLLQLPGVEVLGHRRDIADLMRRSHVFTLPSLEEGSALVTSEARGCGCVLLVSDAAGAICDHDENALVHRAGDVEALTTQLLTLYNDRTRLAQLRENSLRTSSSLTWAAAGHRLRDAMLATAR